MRAAELATDGHGQGKEFNADLRRYFMIGYEQETGPDWIMKDHN